MGNCVAHEPQLHWAGEDWGPALALPEHAQTGSGCDPNRAVACTELKVKITKKQLEELIQKLDAQAGLTVQQVLAQFMKTSPRYQTTHWRPRLQSIPELASSDSSGSG